VRSAMLSPPPKANGEADEARQREEGWVRGAPTHPVSYRCHPSKEGTAPRASLIYPSALGQQRRTTAFQAGGVVLPG